MELRHRFRVPVPVDRAWAAFSRLDRLAPCFPGATLEEVGADQFTGSVNVKLGPVALLYRGTGTYLERNQGRRRVVVQVRGDDARGLGSAVAVVTAQLTGRGDETEVEVSSELELTGKPTRYGSEVVAEVSDRLLDQFAASLAARFADPSFGVAEEEQAESESAAAAVAAPAVDHTAPAGAAAAPPPVLTATRLRPPPETPRPFSPTYAYQAPRNAAQPHGQVVRATATVLARRFGLPAAGVAALLVLVVQVRRRVGRRS